MASSKGWGPTLGAVHPPCSASSPGVLQLEWHAAGGDLIQHGANWGYCQCHVLFTPKWTLWAWVGAGTLGADAMALGGNEDPSPAPPHWIDTHCRAAAWCWAPGCLSAGSTRWRSACSLCPSRADPSSLPFLKDPREHPVRLCLQICPSGSGKGGAAQSQQLCAVTGGGRGADPPPTAPGHSRTGAAHPAFQGPLPTHTCANVVPCLPTLLEQHHNLFAFFWPGRGKLKQQMRLGASGRHVRQWDMWGCAAHNLGSAQPRGHHCNGTHSGITVSMVMCPSGVKLTAVAEDVILSFMPRNTGQLETAAIMCHIPANCSEPSLSGFGEDLGSYHLPGGPIPTVGSCQSVVEDLPPQHSDLPPTTGTCHLPGGPVPTMGPHQLVVRELSAAIGTFHPIAGTCHVPQGLVMYRRDLPPALGDLPPHCRNLPSPMGTCLSAQGPVTCHGDLLFSAGTSQT